MMLSDKRRLMCWLVNAFCCRVSPAAFYMIAPSSIFMVILAVEGAFVGDALLTFFQRYTTDAN
jgi:presenilin-like A22 family membrane protease